MRSIALSCVGLAAAVVLLPAVAQAQASRTYVSSSGHGGTACTRAAPCVRFQDAHDATAAGGIITCLDYGDYGELRVTKSITIECTAAGARIGAPDTGIDISAGVVFTLRGVWIDGGNVGAIGIAMRAGGELHVENCHISGLKGFAPGIGIFLTGSNLDATIVDSVIEDNGLATGGGGVVTFSPAGASRVVLDRVRIQNNTDGLVVQGTGLATVNVHVRDSLVVGNARNGITAARTATVFVDHTSASDNGAAGILAAAAGATVILGGATITRNGTGLVASGGTIESYQNNQASGNDTDGFPSLTLPLK